MKSTQSCTEKSAFAVFKAEVLEVARAIWHSDKKWSKRTKILVCFGAPLVALLVFICVNELVDPSWPIYDWVFDKILRPLYLGWRSTGAQS
jgi:hypothetical protein